MFQRQGANFRESKIQSFAGTNTAILVLRTSNVKNVSSIKLRNCWLQNWGNM